MFVEVIPKKNVNVYTILAYSEAVHFELYNQFHPRLA